MADEIISSEAVTDNIVNNEYGLMNCIVNGEGRQSGWMNVYVLGDVEELVVVWIM